MGGPDGQRGGGIARLDLSDEQKEAIAAIREAYKPQIEAILAERGNISRAEKGWTGARDARGIDRTRRDDVHEDAAAAVNNRNLRRRRRNVSTENFRPPSPRGTRSFLFGFSRSSCVFRTFG